MKADVTDWLLEENNPSIRYLTLIELLGRDEGGTLRAIKRICT